MPLKQALQPLRAGARAAAAAMEAASHAATLAAVLALAWGARRLAADSSEYLANAGGLPRPSLDYAWQVATSPGLHLRLMWWGLSWTCAVFAVGCALLALAGARSLFWRLHGLLRAA